MISSVSARFESTGVVSFMAQDCHKRLDICGPTLKKINQKHEGGDRRAPCAPQYCYAHLLREVQDLEKEFPEHTAWVHCPGASKTSLNQEKSTRRL
jgi:hypothetical protein